MAFQYKTIACGGTFDHFHKGHQSFLRHAFSISEYVYIGITSDAYVASHKEDSIIEPFWVRHKTLTEFIAKEGVSNRVAISPIDTLYMPEIWQNVAFDTLLVTEESMKGAKMLNEERKTQNKQHLLITVSPFVIAEDGLPISASRIRSGIINREGELWIPRDWKQHDRKLPSRLRAILQRPFGVLHHNFDAKRIVADPSQTVTVGDVITKTLHDSKIQQRLAVVDFHVERQKTYADIKELKFQGEERIIRIANPPGMVTASLMTYAASAQNMFLRHKRLIFLIDGEEDLAVLPLVLALPLGFSIFYGQPHVGVVEVVITEEKKAEAFELMRQFLI